MKKIFYLCFSIFLLTGCAQRDRDVFYEINKSDIKLIITEDYIIIDTCAGLTGLNKIIWNFDKTISRSDSTACHELLEKLLVK